MPGLPHKLGIGKERVNDDRAMRTQQCDETVLMPLL